MTSKIERLDRVAAMQGITVDELLARLLRYPDVIPIAFEQAASLTAGMTAGQVAVLAQAEADGRIRAALNEIHQDRARFGARA